MPMNLLHRRLCSSRRWAALVAGWLPEVLRGHDLGEHVLEIGPGFGATTRVLARRVPSLTALEIDPDSVRRPRAELGERVEIARGDGADMPFPDRSFSAVVCFTMLHHLPSAAAQDPLFAEVARVLRPGGLFLGTDSRSSWAFRLLHLGDTMVVVDPASLPGRLARAGLVEVAVDTDRPGTLSFLGRAPDQ